MAKLIDLETEGGGNIEEDQVRGGGCLGVWAEVNLERGSTA